MALAVTVFGFALVGASVEVLADPVRRQRLAGHRRQAGPAARRCVAGAWTMLPYIGRRLLFVVPQLVGIMLVSFLLVKLDPRRSGGA